jgi:hypothetical protein
VKRVGKLEQTIRAFVNEAVPNDHFRDHQDEWHSLCVAMDTLGDTVLALLDFEAHGLGSRIGERYLKLYGFLQAVVLQQDSIQKLAELFLGQKFALSDNSGWMDLRELRNLSVGHPIENISNKRGTTKRVFVSRTTISNQGLFLLLWDRRAAARTGLEVDLQTVYTSYKDEAVSYLVSINEGQHRLWPEVPPEESDG